LVATTEVGELHTQPRTLASDDAAALAHLQAALALARAIKHPETEGEVERVLADLALARGDIDAAAQGHARSLAVCAEAGDLRGEAQARGALARADLAAGRLDAAAGHLHAALQAFDRFAMRAPWLQGLEDTVAWAVQRGGAVMAVAAALAAAADQGRAAAGLARSPRAQQAWLVLLEAQRGALGSSAFDAACQDGLAWDRMQAHRQALATLAGC